MTPALALQDRILQARKLECIGRLAAGFAHDVNNLLSVILACTGFSLEGLPEDDPRRADLLQVKKAGERGAALARQMLASSRLPAPQPMSFDLNGVLDEMAAMLQRMIGSEVALVCTLAPTLGRVTADPRQIERVILNLAINARDAMPAGGTLTLGTANVDLDALFAAQHAGVAAGPYVMVWVSDTGIGMDDRTMARLFEPFFTTKAPGKGTGLGLSTAREIVTQSGGSVVVTSELGRGTTFKIYLPRVAS